MVLEPLGVSGTSTALCRGGIHTNDRSYAASTCYMLPAAHGEDTLAIPLLHIMGQAIRLWWQEGHQGKLSRYTARGRGRGCGLVYGSHASRKEPAPAAVKLPPALL